VICGGVALHIPRRRLPACSNAGRTPRVFFGMDPNLRYGGEALFFLGVAVRLVIWLVRTTRELDVNQDFRSVFSLPRGGPTSTTTSVFTLSSGGPASTIVAPAVPEHRCPKCGAQIHADIVHGGFGSCRRCGWTSDQK
jgi:hypothetical protein